MQASRVQHIDISVFNGLFDKYKNRLYGYILSLTHSEYYAEEITQEIFIKIWISRDLLAKAENLEHYLFTMARNRTISFLRGAAVDMKVLQHLQSQMNTDGNPAEDRLARQEYDKLLLQAVAQLSPQRRTVYQLSRDKGLTLDEIATQMGISRNTAKNHLMAALQFIRSFLSTHQMELLLFFWFYS
ncbi:RNA polymerase sigma-70 factor [Chitinophaga sp.]|uniref:RNA polymerase sigma factor n=1 Tax=Chitinophaga sp. TaxID=1869181 RepID=UPI002F92F5C6